VTRKDIANFALLYLLFRGAEASVKLWARKASAESNGVTGTIGDAIQVGL
jgi:hypothetical protein